MVLKVGAAAVMMAATIVPPGLNWLGARLESLATWQVTAFAAGSVLAIFGSYREKARSKAAIAVLLTVLCMAVLLTVWIPMSDPIRRDSVGATVLYLASGMGAAALLPPGNGLKAFVLLSAVQAVACLFGAVFEVGGIYSADLFRVGGTFSDTNTVSVLLACSAPAAVGVALQQESRAWLIPLALIWLGLILTWSRGPILSASLSTTVVLWRGGGDSRRRTILLAGGIALTVVMGLCLFVREAKPERRASSLKSSISRGRQWQAGWEFFTAHPTGVGPGNVALPVAVDEVRTGTTTILSIDPKNQLLMLLASFGIAGGVIWTGYVAGTVRLFRGEKRISPALTGSFLALLGVSIFDTPFLVPGREIATGLLGLLSGLLLIESRGAFGDLRPPQRSG